MGSEIYQVWVIVITVHMKVKLGMEAKGLRVNAGMTKVTQFRLSRVQSEGFWKACMVCRKGVASNSILRVECLK